MKCPRCKSINITKFYTTYALVESKQIRDGKWEYVTHELNWDDNVKKVKGLRPTYACNNCDYPFYARNKEITINDIELRKDEIIYIPPKKFNMNHEEIEVEE